MEKKLSSMPSRGNLRELTRAEEQIMQVLWRLERAFVKDIVAQLPAPKPAYNTVSTIVRILQEKGFVSHRAFGKTHEYYPLVDKAAYSKFLMQGLVKDYFGGSFGRLMSFFVKTNKVDLQTFEALVSEVQEELDSEAEASDTAQTK